MSKKVLFFIFFLPPLLLRVGKSERTLLLVTFRDWSTCDTLKQSVYNEDEKWVVFKIKNVLRSWYLMSLKKGRKIFWWELLRFTLRKILHNKRYFFFLFLSFTLLIFRASNILSSLHSYYHSSEMLDTSQLPSDRKQNLM